MKPTSRLHRWAPALSATLVLGSGLFQAQADYASTVLANGPVSYWRLNETTQPPAADVANNLGSLADAGDGYYVGDPVKQYAGALVAEPNELAPSFSAGSRVAVPNTPALNPATPFTVECWAWKASGSGYPLGAMSSIYYTGGAERAGWLIYDNDANWQFRLGDMAGYVATAQGGTATLETWYHLAGVFDGSNARLYVNGVEVASVAVSRPPQANPSLPLDIGSASAFSRHFSGVIDEAAVYPTALSAAEILSHYQNGISSSPSKPYSQLVQAQNPAGYWRLNEPTYAPGGTLPVARNLGSTGTGGDGNYNPGVTAGVPGPAYAGFGADNKAAGFNGVVGHVSTPIGLNDLAQFTLTGWVKRGTAHSTRGGYFGQNDLLEFGDAGGGKTMEAWINASGGNIIANYPFKDDEWGFLALVGDGTQTVLYANGEQAGVLAGNVASYGSSSYFFNIGGGGVFNATGDYFLGSIDEVAVFDKALSGQTIRDLYNAANVPPYITQQPVAPSGTVYQGNPVTLAVAAGGSAPLSFQWRKNGADVAGQTAASLVFANIMAADSGTYDVVVRNAYGLATSTAITLDVKTDTSLPTLLYATGNATYNGVRVWFSEPVDAATAQTAANYQLSGGVTVSAAKLSAPAGSPGDNIVDLTTSTQAAGQIYTLTVSGVKDQSFPGNAIAPGSTVEFSSWVRVPGSLMFEVWTGLSTTDNNLANTLLKDPDFPNSPDFVSHTSAFSSRPVYPDDTHEGYGGKMSGLVTPTETGDYRFFLYSDDSSRLYVSTTADPKDATLVAEETDCCDVFQEPGIANDDGTTYPTSEPIRLVAGRQYYVEALWKEGTGGDYCQVAWRNENDFTAASSLPVIPSQYISMVVDPNVDLAFTQQPTDQLGYLPSTGIEIFARDFNANDGGFTVENSTDKVPPRPWVHDPSIGQWVADPEDTSTACTGPYNSRLNSPGITLGQDGTVSLTFSHRYSLEGGLWDAGQVRISVNGGDFTLVPAENFSANGYAEGNIIGNGIALGQRGFNGDSAGYAAGEFITSKALLGTFSKNDTLVVQFAGAWDDCTFAQVPGWSIDSLKLELVPMIIQDFSKNNGNCTVANDPATPPGAWGPWTYAAANGQWAATGSDGNCGGPFNSRLTTPAYVVPQADEVTLSFTHRFSFEGGLYDGGQVRLSVNGGEFTPVPASAFTANGYTEGNIIGNGILLGQRAFNGDSTGFASGAFITSTAVLGSFKASDTIAVQFVGGWDECSGASQPSWAIRRLQLAFGRAPTASTFAAVATASLRGEPAAFSYQWQRKDAANWVDIPGADDASYRIFPVPADFDALFRVVASVPGKSLVSDEVKLVTELEETPTVAIARTASGFTLTFTGKLQSAATVSGAYQDVAGATSPYAVNNPAAPVFFRSVK